MFRIFRPSLVTRLEGIVDGDHLGVGKACIEGQEEIAAAFGRCGNRNGLCAVGDALVFELLAPEEEQLLTKALHFRNYDRSRDDVAVDVVAVRSPLASSAVVDNVIGIEAFMTVIPAVGNVKSASAALGDDCNRAAQITPVFGPVVGRKHF